MMIREQDEEALNPRVLDRVFSQRIYKMSRSLPWQSCLMGFISGVCLTSLLMVVVTSFGAFSVTQLLFTDGISSSTYNSSPTTIGNFERSSSEKGTSMNFQGQSVVEDAFTEKVSALYKAWGDLLSGSVQSFVYADKAPPHFENCKVAVEMNHRLDARPSNGSFPPWNIWKGMLDNIPLWPPDEELNDYRNHLISEGDYPPWISGSDIENYPLTRKVQRDLWLHQHPANCSASEIKFLLADFERLPGFGMGAQLAGMAGILAIAINEKRVLVTGYYNRANHDGCKGSSQSSWSCYFFPETSSECRKRAFEVKQDKAAWESGVITSKENYTSKDIWSGRTPRAWGNPWSIMQPTTEINGSLIIRHRKMDRRWWRAQAVRYLMRFPSEYTCNLMNAQRHAAFGWEAAKMVLSSPASQGGSARSEIERFVWSNQKPWIPRPILSLHVRMGDKACEMKVVDFEHYMNLAERIRKRFPQLDTIWLSTEMQDVIDQSKSYTHWKFYYTNVARQVGNMTMATYEASLGRETSTNYPLVNFLMAAESDFFIGALGSTWCFLIDGMRNTGGKVLSGYLSVNKDRFW